jgi:hypothetical protein
MLSGREEATGNIPWLISFTRAVKHYLFIALMAPSYQSKCLPVDSLDSYLQGLIVKYTVYF